jgi:hypothetical protein
MAFKELTVQEWFFEIEKGLAFRRRYAVEDAWTMLEALYSNVHESQAQNGPNLVASNADTLVSNLFVPYPYLTPEARSLDSVYDVPVVESVDNMLIDEMGMPDEVELMGLSAYLHGTGFGKIGYDSEFGINPKYDIGGNQPVGMSLTQFDTKGWRIEFGKTNPGMPWFQHVEGQDIVMPWGTRDTETAEWIAHRVCRHVDDCKADPKYRKTRDLQPSMTTEDFMRSYQTSARPFKLGRTLSSNSFDTRKAQYVELWEIHDRRTGKIYVIASGYTEFLRNEIDLLQIEGLPFVQLGFWPSSKSVWRTSDAYYLLQAQLELTDIHVQGSKQRRASILKGLYGEDAFDEDELRKMTSSQVGAFAKVKGGMPLDQAIKMFNPPINMQLYQDAEVVRRNAREIVGQSRNDAGETNPGRPTAYEIAAARAGGDQRSNRRQAKVADVYIKAFKKINPILAKNWKAKRVIQIMGPEMAQKWVTFNGDSMRGAFKYKLQFSSEPPHTRGQEKQFAMQMAPYIFQDPYADPVATRKWLMQSIGDASFNAIYAPKVGSPYANVQLPVSGVQGGAGGTPQGQPASPSTQNVLQLQGPQA